MHGKQDKNTGILIAVPTAKEAEAFVLSGNAVEPHNLVSDCLVGDMKVSVLITGVGIPETLNRLALVTERSFTPEYVIHAGIAGSFSRDYPPGSVVVIEKDYFGDLGVYTRNRFYSLAEKKLANGNTFPYAGGWIHLPHAAEWAEKLQVPSVGAVTVAVASSPLLTPDARRPEAIIESMEGAAVALFCQTRNIPLVHVRAVSNFTVNSDSKTWDIDAALRKLRPVLYKILDLIFRK